MRISYYEEDDMLYLEFSKDPIVRDESASLNINIGYTATGLGEITILDAQKSGVYPMQIEKILSEVNGTYLSFLE